MKKILKTAEGKIFITGLLLIAIYITIITIILSFNSSKLTAILSSISAHLLSGRAGGLSVGVEFKLPQLFLIFNATILDMIIVLIFYPLFILTCKNYLHSKFLNNLIQNSIKTAKKNKEKINKKYKYLILLLFVWFPFHMTGPFVGAIIGYFLDIKHFTNLVIVTIGTFLAVISWTVFFSKITNLFGNLSYLVPTLIILFVIIFFIIHWIKNLKRKSRD